MISKFRQTVKKVNFDLKTKFNHIINKINYNEPAPPFKKLYLDPSKIEYKGGSNSNIRIQDGLGQVRSGSWDKELQLFKNGITYRGLTERYNEKKNWKETVYVSERISNNYLPSGYNNIDEYINNRCMYIDELYRSMKEKGYIDKEYKPIDHGNLNLGRKKVLKPRHKLEPLICIGRNGELIVRDGEHRISIAKILQLNEVPVYVLARHKKWQQTRDQVASIPNTKCDRHHPDLNDLYK